MSDYAETPWQTGESHNPDWAHEIFGRERHATAMATVHYNNGNDEPDDIDRATAKRIVECVNACEGIDPRSIPDMLSALKQIWTECNCGARCSRTCDHAIRLNAIAVAEGDFEAAYLEGS